MQTRVLALVALFAAVSVSDTGCGGGAQAPMLVVVTVTPHTASVLVGGTVAFAAVVNGAPVTGVAWSVQEAGGGSIDTSGYYTAPSSTGTFHVVATSVADGTKHDTAIVAVTTTASSVAVSISPKTASTLTGGTLKFAATVTGVTAGQSTAVTWSVQEAGGGTVDQQGNYAAPSSTGPYHVVVTSVADTSKKDTATVSVTATPVIAVSVTPQVASVAPAGTVSFTATVTGTTGAQSKAVTWSVQETGGGTVDSAGNYTAPAIVGTYHVSATSVADTSKRDTATVFVATFTLVPPDRLTLWNPGIPGGVPTRTTVCATINASTYGNGTTDATAGIQSALDACPAGQVVQLSAGNFKITGTLTITKGIVLRGQGPTQTKLLMPVGTNASLITVGTMFFKTTQSVNLAADAPKGSMLVTLASNPGLKVGEIVEIDEITDPSITEFNPVTSTLPTDPSRGWFTRQNRMVGQTLEIASVIGNVVTFTTPLHIGFKTAFTAQLSRFSNFDQGPQVDVVKNAGVEDLYVYGGGDGNLKLANAAYSWVKNVESDYQKGEGIAIDGSFRCVVRDSYVHSTQDPNPGGGGYGFSFSFYSSDNLLENNISWNMNKVMVMRASGGGNVIGYNYMEDGWISYATGFVEVGLNASHMTTPHYELFEGNQSFNFDGDNTWGNAVYITVFRNHLTGKRRSIAPLLLTDQGNPRAIGLMEGHQWYNFVGNVLGTANQNPSPNTSYTYETTWPWNDNPVGMWRLGYNNSDWTALEDLRVRNTMIREGNFDYFTNTVKWTQTAQALPVSLYLTSKPAFFGSNPWPWVDATGTTKVATLPARARFDALHP